MLLNNILGLLNYLEEEENMSQAYSKCLVGGHFLGFLRLNSIFKMQALKIQETVIFEEAFNQNNFDELLCVL